MRAKAWYQILRRIKTTCGVRMWTVENLAVAIGSSRAHVNEVLNNKPGRGGQTRRKLVKVFRREFPDWADEMLEALQWDEKGNQINDVARGTFHMEKS